MAEYVRVLHQGVGPYEQGTVIRKNRFDADQLAHLEAAGAIADAEDAEGEMPVGRLSLDETMRDSSSYTLPNIPNTDVDADTVRAKMGVPREVAAVTTARTIQADADSAARQSIGEPSPTGKSHLQPEVAEALHQETLADQSESPKKST
jgi:hypothetical protein